MSARSKWLLRWSAVLMLAVVLLGGLAGSAQAVEIVRNGSIPAGQTIDDDVLMGATTVTVDGVVNGTLIAAGQTITINGTVKSDAILAAETVVIGEKAVIEGNLFVGGSVVDLRGKVTGSLFGGAASLVAADSARVGRNAYYGGFSFESKPAAVIGRDLYFGGYQAILGGTVRNLEMSAAGIEINGTVSGSANLRVASPGSAQVKGFEAWRGGQPNLPASIEPGLRISEGAKIAGKLTYTSGSEQAGAIQSAPAGGVVYQTPVPDESAQPRTQPRIQPFMVSEGFWLWDLLRNLITILLLGALALWQAPGIYTRGLAQLQQRPLPSIGMGLLLLVGAFFAIPVAAISLILLGLAFSLITLFGAAGIWFGLGFAALGFAATLFFTLYVWAGKLLVSYLIGNWVLTRIAPQLLTRRFWVLAMGAVIFAILAALPFLIGWLFSFVVDLAGAGALWYAWKYRKA